MKKWIVLTVITVFLISGFRFFPPAEGAGAPEQRQALAAVQTAVLAGKGSGQTIQLKETELFIHIGSPVAVANGRLLSLDKENPQLSPIVYQGRTLVPLRVISEYFGAEVNYDAASAQATIRTGVHEAIFPVGKAYYILDGVEKALDVGTRLVSGRAFVPLREICQETLAYSVDYQDNLICISPSAKLTSDSIRDVKSRIGMYVRAADLETLEKYMESDSIVYYNDNLPFLNEEWDMLISEQAMQAESDAGSRAGADVPASAPAPSGIMEDAQPMASATADSVAGSDAGGGYSSTNVQVEGIDEGDIIKTDGKYIYIIAGGYLKVVEAQTMTLAGEYILGDNAAAQEMYLDRDRVVIVGYRYGNQSLVPAPRAVEEERWISMPAQSSSFAFIRVLDTSNMQDIKSIRYYEVEGGVNTSRKKGDFVYLVSSFAQWYRSGGIDIRPYAGENGQVAPMPIESIMIMPGGAGREFLTVSAIDIRNTGEKVTSETIAGGGYVTYMSSSNLYLAVHDGRYTGKETMNIARFSLDGTKIGYAGSGGIEGALNNQFSMDEYNGHLRVATTVSWPETYNNLYVLDANMEVSGLVPGYAKGERIYSARFMGARAYVVTFRQVDPLFVFDLSDPAAPRITGELKVPGFSSYLHPVSDTVLLGVGRDVYDLFRVDSKGDPVVVGQQTGGLKISLFDVSDMGKPKEIDTLVLGSYGESELLYNHKAAMFKADEGLLGFCGYLNEDSGGYFQGAILISYADNTLSEAGRLAYENPYAEYSRGMDLLYTGERLVYIGSRLYYLQDGFLRSFAIDTLEPLASLRLTTNR
ncbi:MAG: beta-propeller domain-containing protein [Clostridiales bacterium]|nr:beta-propeller domain-containing protein [Clostridiales bacterium]